MRRNASPCGGKGGAEEFTAQVVMILLTYTLRQWQLWKFVEETLANLTPESLVQQLNLRQQWVVIYLG